MVYDARAPGVSRILKNDDLINSLYVYTDGSAVVSGDGKGAVKTWNIAEGNVIEIATHIMPDNKPISHIEVSPSHNSEGNLMVVNSYDNILRVYER